MESDYLKSYPDDLFFDPTHLDNHGAEAFTKDLCQFLDVGADPSGVLRK